MHRASNTLIFTLITVLVLCAAFGMWQNTQGGVGGAISVAKVIWLWLAISCFLIIPACLWRDGRRSRAGRRLWGWFVAGFALRAMIELPLLAFTQAWRCGYGIAHDAVMILWLCCGFFTVPRDDRVTITFAMLVSGALSAEMLNARLFSMVADPSRGVYFASHAPVFTSINRITWGEIAVLLPSLAVCVWRHRKEGAA